MNSSKHSYTYDNAYSMSGGVSTFRNYMYNKILRYRHHFGGTYIVNGRT